MSRSSIEMYQTEMSRKWFDLYVEHGAYWIHTGDPADAPYHAILTKGEHSNAFFNSQRLLSNLALLQEAATDLRLLAMAYKIDCEEFDCVVGPQKGATLLAKYLSEGISDNRSHMNPCSWASPRKVLGSDNKTLVGMEFEPDYGKVEAGQNVAFCEDVVTTGGSVQHAVEASKKAGGKILPTLLVLVNRTGQKEVNGFRIISLVDGETLDKGVMKWNPEKEVCPYCAAGSKPIKPKISDENWALLTGIAA